MMRKLFAATLIVLLAFCLCLPCFAATGEIPYVTDTVGLLDTEQQQKLEELATSISETYECSVYIIIVDDFTDYVDTTDCRAAAEALYTQFGLGWGEEKSGELLLLSMAERDYALIAYGYGNIAFTDYGKEQLCGEFLDDFRYDDWYDGFEDYLEESADMLGKARAGTPVDVYQRTPVTDGGEPVGYFHFLTTPVAIYGALAALVISAIIALIVVLIMKSRMKSVAKAYTAGTYIPQGGTVFTVREDDFTHRTQSRVYSPRQKASSGGTTINSGGFSGRSGKF